MVKKKENAKAILKGELEHQEKTSERILSKNSLSIVVLRVFRRQEKVCLRIMYPILIVRVKMINLMSVLSKVL